MGWSDVGAGGGGDFLKVEAGKKLRLHVLTDDPYSYKQVFFNSLNRGAVLSEETEALIEDKRSIRPQHAFWVITEGGEAKVWQMGNTLARMVKEIYDNYAGFGEVDLIVSRSGTGKDTKYICTPVPTKIDVTIDADSLTPLEEVLVPASADDVEKMVAGIDPSTEFDPAALEKQTAKPKAKTPPVEEEEAVAEEETPAEESVEEEAPPVKPTPKPATTQTPSQAVVLKDIMMLIGKSAKYKTPQGKQMLLKKCAPGKATFSSLNLQELIKVRNELKK